MKVLSENPEELEIFERDTLIPIYERMKTTPSSCLSHEQILECVAEWDREDDRNEQLTSALKRSA